MSSLNPPPNFSRKPRISVRQVWRRTIPKSPSPSQSVSPSYQPRATFQPTPPPTNNPNREQMVNQLHQISQLLETNLHHASNAYSQVPPSLRSPSPPLIHLLLPKSTFIRVSTSKLALLNSGTSSKSSMIKNKGLVTDAYEWDEEDVSSCDNDMTEVKVLMALADDENVHPLPHWRSSASIKPVSGPKTIKSILKSNFTFKADTLKGVTINEPSSAPDKGINDGSASKNNSAPTSKMKNVKTEDDSPLSIVMKELNDLKLQISKNQSSYSRTNKSQQSDIKKPIWYLDSECSRHMTGVKRYLHKYVEQAGLKVMFGDDPQSCYH
ncbi:hypothetical protein Tco_1246460 [Tanacetum coccineum]